MQPLPSTTVRSSTWRTRWWSIATSPSSLTSTTVSPMAGCASRAEISVVLPLPRKPVTRTTGSRSAIAAQGGDEGRVERVERAAGEPFGLGPQGREVVDDLGAALAVVQDVRRPAPVAKRHAEAGQDAPDDPRPQDAPAPRAALGVGPVL